MEIIEKKENKIIFKAKMDTSLSNAIRRYVFHIPVLAIDEVEIHKNDSALYDETIAHRIGLIPLDSKKVSQKKEVNLKLDVKKEGIVYSGEFHGDVKPAYDKIPITSLGKGQEIELTAIARMGQGSTHAKFSPGFMTYREAMEVKVDKNIPKEFLDELPEQVVKKGEAIVYDPSVLEKVEYCAEIANKKDKEYVKITPSGEVVLSVESFGQITPEEIFKKAMEALKDDMEDLSKSISKS
ncbi:MAG: DNA-directed RNA polymerase subunit D [Nanoarchaeota archaeon]